MTRAHGFARHRNGMGIISDTLARDVYARDFLSMDRTRPERGARHWVSFDHRIDADGTIELRVNENDLVFTVAELGETGESGPRRAFEADPRVVERLGEYLPADDTESVTAGAD